MEHSPQRDIRIGLQVNMKIPARLTIQDEIQHRLIAAVFSQEIAPRLVFHGGTMLRVCGVPDYRFSEDLDLLLEGLTQETFYSALEEAFREVGKQTNVKMSIHSDSFSPKDYILWECENETGTIDLDIKTVPRITNIETEIFGIQPNHNGLPEGLPVRCYSLAQVLATKFACVSDRAEGRDLYDMWALSENRETLEKAWDLHRKGFPVTECEIPPKGIARHLNSQQEKFVSAIAIANAALAISAPVPPRAMVAKVVERCLRLKGMEPITPVHM